MSRDSLVVEALRVRDAEGRTLVDDVTFTIPPGTVLGVVGPSGSGKSLLARSILGLPPKGLETSAGILRFGDTDLAALDERGWRRVRGARIGLVLQDALGSLDPLRTIASEVEEAIAAHAALGRNDLRSAALEALRRAGMPDAERRAHHYAHELSGGLRQRALIASAIAAGPTLLIADEPTTALDVTIQAQVLDELAHRRAAGMSLMIISHDLAVVAAIADQIIVMDRGRIVERGESAAVIHSPEHATTQALIAAVPRRESRTSRAAGSETPVLRMRGVGVRHGRRGAERPALQNVDLDVRPGTVLGLVGESASGKSTLARVAVGLTLPTEGTISVGGTRPSDGRRPRGAAVSAVQLVAQDPLGSFDPRWSVGRIIAEPLVRARVGHRERRHRIDELLDLVALDGRLLHAHPTRLSGGQRQRVAIARALAARPRLIVADEPVSALDVVVQKRILSAIRALVDTTGIAVLLISHDIAVIESISDDIAVLEQGQLVESGELESVLRQPRHSATRALLAATPRFGAPQDRS